MTIVEPAGRNATWVPAAQKKFGTVTTLSARATDALPPRSAALSATRATARAAKPIVRAFRVILSSSQGGRLRRDDVEADRVDGCGTRRIRGIPGRDLEFGDAAVDVRNPAPSHRHQPKRGREILLLR